jgi:F-type H+-transporting ATPase subunit epsilon
MQLEIITPEKQIFAGNAEAVQLPGLDGLFQVLNNHAPVISALSKGTVKINLTAALAEDDKSDSIRTEGNDNKTIFVDVAGGVAEMVNNKLIVLAE